VITLEVVGFAFLRVMQGLVGVVKLVLSECKVEYVEPRWCTPV
jgi:hypothetical protein